jgi:ketosteroid isomerase-like protein
VNGMIATMDYAAADAFARRWVDAWNEHDVEAVLALFSEDVVFTSPHAAQLLEGSDGTVRGKDALRRYWQEGVRRIPDLHFELLGVYTGIHTLVLNYRNQRGGLASEVLVFDGPLVAQGHGTYREDVPYHAPGQ